MPASGRPKHETTVRMKKQRVLVVDDSTVIRQQISSALTDAGYDVIEADSGDDGLRKIASNSDVRLVICDVNMPGKSGLDVLASLNESGLMARLSVLMLTSEVQAELLARAKRLGAKGWMVKPVTSEALVATVKKLLA